uniref:AAA+ ATPase domain-containing protein n=1 Tax=Rhizochromulina marina TaxID=1034831 RepID=A0A7S2SEJ8_9STRA|mmetsp:Transcript_2878/g.8198  ORF Transcript_2878/g.8198 Transcript_2878/m.8198 type:complete len:353 (+) Transcript_2878:101-1159(+)
MLFVDKHRPTTLGKLDFNEQLTQRLQGLAADGDLPHLIVYGPSGAGKKTRINALLREMYGSAVERRRLDHRSFKTPSNRTVELTTIASNYHIEMNASDAGIYDRIVIQDIIKEIAQSNPLHTQEGAKSFKVVLLMEVDRLTRQAQAALRRTMEKYTSSCRLILYCTNPSKVIEPVRSRCLGIRVAAPTEDEVCGVLANVARKEKLTMPPELALRIAKLSGRNVRRALLMLEATKVQQYPFTVDQTVQLPDWELYIATLAQEMTTDQSPQKLIKAREMLYELLTNCIPADVIMKTLTRELCKSLDDQLKHEVAHWAAFYEHRIVIGSKEIFHLEAFVAKFMSLYKQFLVNLFM